MHDIKVVKDMLYKVSSQHSPHDPLEVLGQAQLAFGKRDFRKATFLSTAAYWLREGEQHLSEAFSLFNSEGTCLDIAEDGNQAIEQAMLAEVAHQRGNLLLRLWNLCETAKTAGFEENLPQILESIRDYFGIISKEALADTFIEHIRILSKIFILDSRALQVLAQEQVAHAKEIVNDDKSTIERVAQIAINEANQRNMVVPFAFGEIPLSAVPGMSARQLVDEYKQRSK
jgi:hypothetical protein